MIGLNLMYAVALLPLEFVGINFYLALEHEEVLQAFAANPFVTVISFLIEQPVLLVLFLIGIPLGACATAGFTYIQRNAVREEHVFLFSDFLEHAKKNFKQACIFGVIDTLLLFVQINLILLYLPRLEQMIYVIPFFISCAVTLLYLFMRYYVYLIMVTFDMKLYAILKNSFLFAIGAVFRNILVLAILVGLFILCFYNHIIGMLLCAVILYSLMGFVINFNAYPMVRRFLINPYYDQMEAQKEAEGLPEKSQEIFSDDTK